MKLVRMADGKIGLFVLLPKGAYVIDIASSLGVFSHDPLSNGLLNGVLKDGSDGFLKVPLWPWPMNGRIVAATQQAGYVMEDFDTWRKGVFGQSPDD